MQEIFGGDILLPKGHIINGIIAGQAMPRWMRPNLWPNGQVYFDMDKSKYFEKT